MRMSQLSKRQLIDLLRGLVHAITDGGGDANELATTRAVDQRGVILDDLCVAEGAELQGLAELQTDGKWIIAVSPKGRRERGVKAAILAGLMLLAPAFASAQETCESQLRQSRLHYQQLAESYRVLGTFYTDLAGRYRNIRQNRQDIIREYYKLFATSRKKFVITRARCGAKCARYRFNYRVKVYDFFME